MLTRYDLDISHRIGVQDQFDPKPLELMITVHSCGFIGSSSGDVGGYERMSGCTVKGETGKGVDAGLWEVGYHPLAPPD
jgi:hypothetical protein